MTSSSHTSRLGFILGPCVIESRTLCLRVAEHLAHMAQRLHVDILFKASFDKANRTHHDAFRGPGLVEGLRILEAVREASGLRVLTDIHEPSQAAPVAEVVDVLQIPAFLCRQSDLLEAAGRTGRPVQLKKGPFLAPSAMAHACTKLRMAGAAAVWLCERGTSFGHGDLIVDMRGLVTMAALRVSDDRLVFDATHAVQRPGALGDRSGGERHFVPALARAAVAVGVDMIFAEVHPDPSHARSDAATQWPLSQLEPLMRDLLAIDNARRNLTPVSIQEP